MVEKNELYIIEITDISSDGNGVGAVDGFTVFVPSSAVGDIVEIRITKVKPRYAQGVINKINSPSADRTEPPCKAYSECGGCQLLHIDYEAQKRAKKNFIESAFQRIGGFKNFKCDEIITMDKPERYRNKCIYQIGTDGSGTPVSGFFANRSHDIIPIKDCLISPEINSDINNAVLEYIKESGGEINSLFIRHARTTGEIMVLAKTDGSSLPCREMFIKRLLSASDKIVSIYIGTTKGNKLIYGKSEITDTLCGIEFKISPDSFYQVNPYMTEMLYNKALEYAEITENDNVLDVYCGIGTISLVAAKTAKYVTGVELVKQAIENAKDNAKNNGITNAEFFADSAENAVPKLIKGGMKPNIVILDPPRKGSDEKTLEAIVSAAPERIVYVSCNPATLARDARYLAERGYMPQRCTGVDMFPGTFHVETVCLMSRICSGK